MILKKNKKGLIRILEAFVSVMIVFTVLLVVLARQPQFKQTTEEELTTIQRHVLEQVSQDPDLRDQVLSNNKEGVNDIIGGIMPQGYSYDVAICDLGESCSSEVVAYVEDEVFVEEAVISANLQEYDPTILKLFFWEGEYPEQYESQCGDGRCDGGAGENSENCPEDCEVICSSQCSPVGRIETDCSDTITVRTRTCGYYDPDPCPEWSSPSLTECPSGQVCSQGSCVEDTAVAIPSLTFSDVVYSWDGARHVYTHTRTFKESGGVGYTLNRAELWEDENLINSGNVDYSINANEDLVQINHKVGTASIDSIFVLKYWGTDDNSNDVYVEQSLCVDEESFTPNC